MTTPFASGARRDATMDEVRKIIGPFEDDVVAKITNIHATAEEVSEAYRWVRSDECMQRHLSPDLRGKTAEVFDILKGEFPDLCGNQM